MTEVNYNVKVELKSGEVETWYLSIDSLFTDTPAHLEKTRKEAEKIAMNSLPAKERRELKSLTLSEVYAAEMKEAKKK